MHKQRHYIEVCRRDRMVYLRTLKCASTFFYWNFTKDLGWQEISWHNIDWQHDHVFSHMLEPVARRHKAVAERLAMMGLCEEYLQNEKLQQCLEHALILDQHSESYVTRYGSGCKHIDWIPLQNNNVKNIELTEMLLAHNGITNVDWNRGYAHDGAVNKKQVEQLLTKKWNQALYQGQLLEWQQNHLQADLDLYAAVTEKFDPNADVWSQATWLK